MYLKELTIEEFTEFQKTHPLSNYHQTINYALLMSEIGYDYDLIGYVNDYENILAATLILIKPIGFKCFYGYAPQGFLIDFENLLKHILYLLSILLLILHFVYYYFLNIAPHPH